METAVHPNQVEQTVEAQANEAPAAKTDAAKMFRYSTFLDVGEGAESCEHARDGQCQDAEHFHAWVRLPNPFQQQDIREKGLAAKARKLRDLRDPESNASVILDASLSDVGDPLFVESLIDELLAREWADNYLTAQGDVKEREEFEHVEQDSEEYARLRKAEGDVSDDDHSPEFRDLARQITAYVEAINQRLRDVQEPKRAELRTRSVEDLISIVRAKRAEEEGDAAFLETYNAWTWFVGTLKVELHPVLRRPHLAMWEEIGVKNRPAAGTMFGEAPEVIAALKSAFNQLQLSLQQASAGN